MSNYVRKTDLKNATHVDTSSFALKTNVANLKTEFDKLDIDKLESVPVDLSKLSDVVKNDVVKKDVYDKLLVKVDDIDNSDFVLKTNYNADKTKLEKKIPDTGSLVKKTDYNTNIEGKIHGISNLATKIALTTVENKIPDVSSLVKKTDYNTRVAEIDTKVSSLDGKTHENKTRNESIKNELIGSMKDNLSIFWGNIVFDRGDCSQAYLIFQPLHRYVKIIANTKHISEWKPKGLSDKSIKPPPTSNKSLTPLIDYYSYNI